MWFLKQFGQNFIINIPPLFIIFARNFKYIISETTMIVNYDSDNGWNLFFEKFSQTPKITKEVENALSKLPKVNMDVISSASDLGDIIGYTNDDFYEFAKSADLSGDLIVQYQKHLESASSGTSKFSSTLKNLGGTLLSTFANMAIMYAASAVQSWDS